MSHLQRICDLFVLLLSHAIANHVAYHGVRMLPPGPPRHRHGWALSDAYPCPVSPAPWVLPRESCPVSPAP